MEQIIKMIQDMKRRYEFQRINELESGDSEMADLWQQSIDDCEKAISALKDIS
jgi:hypothetical protein